MENRRFRWRVSYTLCVKERNDSNTSWHLRYFLFSHTSFDTRLLITVTVSVRSVKPAGGGGGGWEMKSTCLPSLSCLSGSPCKTETDEAAGTCSPVHWGILRPIHTNARCLYPLSHVGLVSAKPVRAGCLSNRRRGWLHTRSVFRH